MHSGSCTSEKTFQGLVRRALKENSVVLLLALTVGVLCSCACWLRGDDIGALAGEARQTLTQKQIRELINSLPPRSHLREALERGATGDGIPHPWMDGMRREGVKRVLVRTEFVWRGKPTEIRVSRMVYFGKYDQDCAQIADPQQLLRIHTSGLDQELGKAAIQRTSHAHWLFLDKGHPTKHGVGTVELLDDEWLPNIRADTLAPGPVAPSRFREAVDMDDVAEVKSLLQRGVSAEERDTALWVSLTEDDPCMTKALLNGGVSPDLRDRFGFTVLMAAVRYKALRNVEVLLAAGAKVDARAKNGETAMSTARRQNDDQIIQLLRKSGARD